MGGYGSAVLELFNEKRITTPVVRIGWPDQFIEHATTVDDLREKYGLTAENTSSRKLSEFRHRRTPARTRSPEHDAQVGTWRCAVDSLHSHRLADCPAPQCEPLPVCTFKLKFTLTWLIKT